MYRYCLLPSCCRNIWLTAGPGSGKCAITVADCAGASLAIAHCNVNPKNAPSATPALIRFCQLALLMLFNRLPSSAPFSLLLSVDPDTTVRALGGAPCARLQGHEHMIVRGINGHAVGIGVGDDILQPEIGASINDAEHGPSRHVSGGQVVAIVAGIVPDFVHAAYIV